MAEAGEEISEDLKQAVALKGKAKQLQPTQRYGRYSITPGSSSSSLQPKSLVLPIAELAPGQTILNWEIRGLVVRKSDIKPYTNRHGVYFSFEMRDQAGGEIRVVCFQGEVSRFFDKVVEGKEHVLTRGKLMKPKERFNRMNRRCEIVLEYDSEIRLLQEEEEDEEDKENKSLMERVREIHKALEFCTSKLQELKTEIKNAGKIGNHPAAAAAGTTTTTSIVKMEAPNVVGVSENRSQQPLKIESPAIRKTISSSSTTTTRGAGLGTRTLVLPRMGNSPRP